MLIWLDSYSCSNPCSFPWEQNLIMCPFSQYPIVSYRRLWSLFAVFQYVWHMVPKTLFNKSVTLLCSWSKVWLCATASMLWDSSVLLTVDTLAGVISSLVSLVSTWGNCWSMIDIWSRNPCMKASFTIFSILLTTNPANPCQSPDVVGIGINGFACPFDLY